MPKFSLSGFGVSFGRRPTGAVPTPLGVIDPAVHCPACGSSQIEGAGGFRNTGKHRADAFDDLAVMVCKSCESGWAAKSPSDDVLSRYYANDYTPARSGSVKADVWPVWDNRAASLLMLGRVFGSFDEGDLFVDVGPGAGAALGLARWLLPKPALACVEFNSASIRYFQRHIPDIRITRSISAFEPASVGMIYSSHSLEHFRPEQVGTEIEAMARALKPGGVVVIEVPFGDVVRAKFHTPHLLFFSKAGLATLMERAGLQVGLAMVAEGGVRNAKKAIDQRFHRDIPEELAPARVLQMGDLIPAKTPGLGTVIKCVAIKPG